MNINRVYIGYDREYNKRLFYIMDDGNYKDLESKEIINPDDIVVDIEYNQIYNAKIPLRSNLLRKFKRGEGNRILVGTLYIGNVNRVVKVLSEFPVGKNYGLEQKLTLQPMLSNVLLEDDGYHSYSNLIDGFIYDHDIGYIPGDYFVDKDSLIPFSVEFNVPERKLPIVKVLEMYSRKYGGK